MVNHGGCSSTTVPFGEITEHEYVSGLIPTLSTVLLTTWDPLNAHIVTEGRFKFDGEPFKLLQNPPVAVFTVSGSTSGREHRKLM